MEKYNYLQEVISDVKDYIRENDIKITYSNRREIEEKLNEDLWVSDSVTGNASGSYTCNAWRAEEYLCHNWDLLEEAMNEFDYIENPIEKGAEWCDVIIRCYLLSEAISSALDDMEEDDYEE